MGMFFEESPPQQKWNRLLSCGRAVITFTAEYLSDLWLSLKGPLIIVLELLKLFLILPLELYHANSAKTVGCYMHYAGLLP